MAEQIQVNGSVRALELVLKEVEQHVKGERSSEDTTSFNVKDFRWRFDQVSAKMNQAIYNEQSDKIHETCLKTVGVLIEILART